MCCLVLRLPRLLTATDLPRLLHKDSGKACKCHQLLGLDGVSCIHWQQLKMPNIFLFFLCLWFLQMSMNASRQIHAIPITSVTTLLDRTRVSVLQDLLRTLPPRVTWNRCVMVRKLVHIVWDTYLSRAMLISVQYYIREVMKESFYDITYLISRFVV